MLARDIKREILAKIVGSDGLRYKDARPLGVENDLFNYHLQHLVRKGLVEKRKGRYFLTTDGKKYVEVVKPVDPTGKTADHFRLNILAILLRGGEKGVEVLSQTKKTSPYRGDKGVIGGAVKEGEFVASAAGRRFKEETGLIAEFIHIGTIRLIRKYPKNKIFSDIIFNICAATKYEGNLVKENKFGVNKWVAIEDAIKNEQISIQGSKELVKILKMLKYKDPLGIPFFYKEEETTLPSLSTSIT